jgi:hypothetical protein
MGYYNRNGFSDRARGEFDRLFADPSLPEGAVYRFIDFLNGTDYASPSTKATLIAIAKDPSKDNYLRRKTAELFSKRGEDTELVSESASVSPEGRDVFRNALTERQHVPTIKRELSILLNDRNLLIAAEKPFPYDPDILWIANIKTKEAWDSLRKLWGQCIDLSLESCTRIVESTLFRLDSEALIETMRNKSRGASDGIGESLRYRTSLYEHQRDAERARAVKFDEVVHKLAVSTTLKKVKVWCEGPTDRPSFASMLEKICAERSEFISIQSINGWANALNPSYDLSTLLDGCLFAIVVMDGDNGRDFKRSGKPLSKLALDLKRRLDKLNIPLRVLERYGIENYFSRSALEAVLGRDLSGAFPLLEDKAICIAIPGYNKNLNDQVIQRMSPDDLENTDFLEIITEIRKWAGL